MEYQGLIVNVPTREEIERIEVGSLALDCWGRLAEVTNVYAREVDVYGKLFCCYYTRCRSGNGATSMSQKEGQLTRTVALSNRYLSRELDDLEARLLATEL